MKGLSIKKLAAVGAGLALVGSAVAPMVTAGALNLAKNDLFNSDGTPKVKVVVGSASAPSDGVWAGNIAAAIANKARVYESVDVSGDSGPGGSTPSVTELSAKLVIGGTVTYNNAKTLTLGESAGTLDMNSLSGSTKEVPGVEVSHSSFPNLKEESVTINWAGTSYSRTFKEKLGIKADVLFDYQNGGGVSDLEVEIVGQDLNYIADLGSGIPVYESTTSITAFTDGTNDNIIVPFLGENFLVREVNKASNFVRLIKSEETTAFNEGDVVPDLPGKNSLAGQSVSVRVDSIVATGPAAASYSADVTLIDEEGNERITKTVAAGENINQALTVDGKEAVDTILYVDSIGVAASSGVGSIKLLVGTNLVDLYHGKGYPYDSTQTSSFPYTVNLTYSSDGNYVTKITIYNDNKVWRNGSAGIHAGPPLYAPASQALTSAGQAGTNKAMFLSNLTEGQLGKDLFAVEFAGLETNESLNTIRFYNHTLEYTDAGDRAHKLPMYIQLSKDGDSSFEFDSRTIYYKSSSTNVNFDMNRTLNGVKTLIDYNACWHASCQGITSVGTAVLNFGNARDVNVPEAGRVDVNGFYFTLTNADNNVGVLGDANVGTFTADGNVTFSMAAISSSSSADYLESYVDDTGVTRNYLLWGDANTSNYTAGIGNTVTLKGRDDITFEYALYGDSTATGDLYLLLDRSNTLTGRFDADIKPWGTDIDEDLILTGVQGDGNVNAESRPYYWPNHSDFGGAVSNDYYTAVFGVETAGNTTGAAEVTQDYDTNVYIDTNPSQGNAPNFPNNNLTRPTSDVNFNSGLTPGDGSVSFFLDEDPATSTQPNKAYNDFGTYYEVVGGQVKIQVPDNVRRPVIVVTMAGSTSEVTGGEELLVAEGETGTTNSGSKITVEEITYTASCGSGSAVPGTCVANPENYWAPVDVRTPLVFLDNEVPSGKLILVGGHFVNTMTAQVSGISDKLTSPGDGQVPEVDEATGNIVVAGYTVDDTVAAARDLIESIEDVDMMG